MGWLDGHQLGASAPEILRVAGTIAWAGGACAALAIARRGGPWRPLGIAAGIGAATMIPSLDTAGASVATAIATGAWIAIVRGTRGVEWRALRRARVAYLRGPRAPDLAIAIAVTVACVALSFALFDATPVIQDSQAQLLHARIFASGRLVASSPPSPEHFLADHVITTPAFYSQYPPGHVAVLALGVLVRAPWIVNPILGGVAILIVGALARELARGRGAAGERTARRAVLMAALSPFVLLMSSEAMSHATGLVCAALLAWMIARWRRTGSLRCAIAAGAAGGALVLVRPLSAIGIGLPLAIVVLASARGGRGGGRGGGRPGGVLAMALGAAAIGSLLFAFNAATHGDPIVMGYTVRWGAEHTLGFGIAPWGAPHTPLRGLEHTLSNLVGWNLFLFGAPIPAVALVALGAIRDRADAMTRALAAAPACVLAIHFFYFFQDLTFGPRYLYEASAGAIVLAARGLPWIGALARGVGRRAPVGRAPVGRAIVVALALSIAFWWPALVHEYHGGFCPRGGIVDRAAIAIPEGQALVFVDGAYERAFYAVDPDLRARILFARDLGDARNDQLRCALADREAWLDRGGALRRLPRAPCRGSLDTSRSD